ncbi:MAG TPA: DUF4199 domain-containing protein [Steroidobacteraceae bacterium]|nr:DUF4199 domain-containing protein [Steroidobacteraceae bacterium]
MLPLILRYGLIGGLIVAAPMTWRMFTADPQNPGDPLGGMLIGYLTMLVALTSVFLGIKQYRDRFKGGVVKFGAAFGVGLAISAVACVIYVIAWEICMAFAPVDFIAMYSNAMIDSVKNHGGTPEQIAKATAEAKDFATMYAKPLVRIPMTFVEMFPVGLLVSLISAAVLRNPRVLPARAPA